jgi:hypothetical protein
MQPACSSSPGANTACICIQSRAVRCCCCCCRRSVAFKLLSSTNLAASTKVTAEEMGSGEYSFIPDGVNTPARINLASRATTVTITSLKACLKACSNINLCSGVVFSGEDTITSCNLIMGPSLPGNSFRTLIKANFMGLNTNMKVSKGYYSQPGTTTVEICPAEPLQTTAGCFW